VIYCAPGNAGIASLARCAAVKADDLDGVVALARQEAVDLVFCGPETPLVAGLTERLEAERIPTFGPSAAAARLEGSKAWARDVMRKAGLPIPDYAVFAVAAEAGAYVRAHPGPCFVKADGPAAGKGAIACENADDALAAIREMMVDRVFGESGSRIVVEERLVGEEFSAMAFLQGDVIHPMVVSQDHKRACDGDRGPNTGGMGACSPVPSVTGAMEREMVDRVLRPLVAALAEERIAYHGVLYPGMIITGDGIKIIEFNARFGDPETQVILPRMESDLLEILEAGAHGELTQGMAIRWKPDACACVVMTSGGYPGPYATGKPISGLEDAGKVPDSVVFHAGTAFDPEGRIVTAGGRVLGVTAWGPDGRTALDRAYEAADLIHWEGAFYRKDIGHRFLAR